MLLTSFHALYKDVSADVKDKMKYHLDDGTRPYSYGYQREGIMEEIDAGGVYMDKVNFTTVNDGIFRNALVLATVTKTCPLIVLYDVDAA